MPARHVLIVEDLPDTLAWLAAVAREITGAEPAMAASLSAARAWVARRPAGPLLALVDIGLPDGSGLSLVAELARDPAATAVVTTIFDDDETLIAAFAAGAHGYLLKSAGRADVEARLRALDAGEVAISPSMARRLLQRLRQPPAAASALTPREREVLSMIGRGLTLGEAGVVLGISSQTVATHVKTIYRKLNIASRAEAALEARHLGLA